MVHKILFFPLIFCFFFLLSPALAETTQTIHAEWSQYTPPTGYSVSSYNLYKEGELTCQSFSASATSIDCQVTISAYTTSFTLSVSFTNGSESPQSAPFTFTIHGSNIEVGEVEADHQWQHVSFEQSFSNPIVIAGPPTYYGSNPCVIRLRNVSSSGFDVKISEWNYLDGTHKKESINYLVAEKGSTILADGSRLEAGSFSSGIPLTKISYSSTFSVKPVVISTISSNNESATITGRIRNTSKSGFEYRLQEQESNKQNHVNEIINYIAWEPGEGNIDGFSYKVSATANTVTHSWYTVESGNFLNNRPFFLADAQTTNEGDPCGLRARFNAKGIQVFLQEEKSRDSETKHSQETVGYITIDQ